MRNFTSRRWRRTFALAADGARREVRGDAEECSVLHPPTDGVIRQLQPVGADPVKKSIHIREPGEGRHQIVQDAAPPLNELPAPPPVPERSIHLLVKLPVGRAALVVVGVGDLRVKLSVLAQMIPNDTARHERQ